MSSQHIPDREEALALLKEHTKAEHLLKHAFAVEGVMKRFAEKFGEDADKWGIIGLIHDLDFESYPDEHCHKSKEILSEAGWPEDYIRAMMSHGWTICTDVEPLHIMEKVLFATDELTGLITATALVRPSKSIMDVEVKSVKKKFKEKSFSAAVNRDIIDKGAELLNIERGELIAETLLAMKNVSHAIGLE